MIKWTQGGWGQQSKGAYVPPSAGSRQYEEEMDHRGSKRGRDDNIERSGNIRDCVFGDRSPNRRDSYVDTKRTFSGDGNCNSPPFRDRVTRPINLDENLRRSNPQNGARASYDKPHDQGQSQRGPPRDNGRDGDEPVNRERDWDRTNKNVQREPSRDRGWNGSNLSEQPRHAPERRDFRDTSRDREVGRDRNSLSTRSGYSDPIGRHERGYSSRSRSSTRQIEPLPTTHHRSARDAEDSRTQRNVGSGARVSRNLDKIDTRRVTNDLESQRTASRSLDVFDDRTTRTASQNSDGFANSLRPTGSSDDFRDNVRATSHQNLDGYRNRRSQDSGHTGLENHRESRNASLGASRSRDLETNSNSRDRCRSSGNSTGHSTQQVGNAGGFQDKGGRSGCSSSRSRTQQSLGRDGDDHQAVGRNFSSSSAGGVPSMRDGTASVIKPEVTSKRRECLSGESLSDLPHRQRNQQSSLASSVNVVDDDERNRKRAPVVRKAQAVRKRQMFSTEPQVRSDVLRCGDVSQTNVVDKCRRTSTSDSNSEMKGNTHRNTAALTFLESLAGSIDAPDRGAAALSFLESLLSSSQPDVAPAKSAAFLFLQSLSLSLLAEDSKLAAEIMPARASSAGPLVVVPDEPKIVSEASISNHSQVPHNCLLLPDC